MIYPVTTDTNSYYYVMKKMLILTIGLSAVR